jgi:hypothetical protein
MPSFATDTVHGLSADVYFNSIAQRVFGDIVWSTTLEILDLTANDEGNVNPVDTLRRGDVTRITVPLSDSTGLGTLSGTIYPFATSTAGVSGTVVLLPKAAVGDSYLTVAKELRLVARDGSFTLIAAAASVVEVGDVVLSEENQMVSPVTFQLFRTTISGVETPYRIYSGAVVTGG